MNYLIGIHATLGELGAIGFLWIFIELLNPSKKGIKRIKLVSLVALILIILSWISAGWYYVNVYGPSVKPIIKAGPQPWAHAIFMEAKEHIFLFIPFISLLANFVIRKHGRHLINRRKTKTALMILCLFIFLLAMAMALMGYFISSGARAALEAG
ncbi:hypothetical protein HYV50_04245 [Candidatus Pacearchaeota archaeon]|nr:hypothetical protein [Candidatus Pacearchaeota archaeon]